MVGFKAKRLKCDKT